MHKCHWCNSPHTVYFSILNGTNNTCYMCEGCEHEWRSRMENVTEALSHHTYFNTYEDLQLELIKRRL